MKELIDEFNAEAHKLMKKLEGVPEHDPRFEEIRQLKSKFLEIISNWNTIIDKHPPMN